MLRLPRSVRQATAFCGMLLMGAALAFERRICAVPGLVLFAVWGYYSESWGKGTRYRTLLADTIRDAKASGIEHVVLVGAAPSFS